MPASRGEDSHKVATSAKQLFAFDNFWEKPAFVSYLVPGRSIHAWEGPIAKTS